MNVIGMLARGSSLLIAFCTYGYSEFENALIDDFLDNIPNIDELNASEVKLLAFEAEGDMDLESEEELKKRKLSLIGIAYKKQYLEVAMLPQYTELEVYVCEMAEGSELFD